MITQRWSFFDLLLALLFRHNNIQSNGSLLLKPYFLFWKKENEFYAVTFIFKKQNYTNIAKPLSSLFSQKIIALTFLVQIQRATAQVMSQKERFKVLISKSQKNNLPANPLIYYFRLLIHELISAAYFVVFSKVDESKPFC